MRARLWSYSDAWERAHSNDAELWQEETARNRELNEQAYAVEDTDPAAAFRLYLEAAEAGSPWGMEMVGRHYDWGIGVEADFQKAAEYYHRALSAGSWMATIGYARLLEEHGYQDDCERVLEDGVASDFVPAYFCLAWIRYQRCKSRAACREIRPLLEYAASKGHPAAKVTLTRLMARGKFGLRAIPTAFRLLWRWAPQLDLEAKQAEEEVRQRRTAAEAPAPH
ncbi:MAG: hypothetical protein M3177_00115 [Pseudomonadota bacterium]|nr:hypothetical protein [Pseudomonadota bacterium]